MARREAKVRTRPEPPRPFLHETRQTGQWQSRRPTAVAVLAYPETTASAVYGMYDLFVSAGRDWGFVVDGEPGPELMRAAVVAATDGAFEAANGVTILPHLTLEGAGHPDIVCVPELAVPPGGELGHRFNREIEWIRARYEAGAVVASACSGAVLLALAGLLDGQDATTHWAYATPFASSFQRSGCTPSGPSSWPARGSAWSWPAPGRRGRTSRSTSSGGSPESTPRCTWRAST